MLLHQGYIHNGIDKALHEFASAYLDDVLVYSDSDEEYVSHVKWIIQQLLDAGLYLKLEKWEFHKDTVKYLGLTISTKKSSMDEDKVETVRNGSREMMTANGRLNHLFEVHQFLGFCHYYQWFISKYSEKAEPLTRLTKEDELFLWEAEQQLALETMVDAFTEATAHWHFDHNREVIIEMDDSDYVSAGVVTW